MTKSRAWRLKNISVYVGIVAYVAMLVSGDVVIGAAGKLFAEILRIPYFRATDAKDMMRMSYFFIAASLSVIIPSILNKWLNLF